MCVKKIPIQSYKQYRAVRPSLALTRYVPCGACPECLAQRQNDWFVRSYQQLRATQASGGKCLFLTFTYDEEHVHHLGTTLLDYINDLALGEVKRTLYQNSSILPSLLDDLAECSYQTDGLCFSHSDVARMVNTLRHRFSRAGISPKFHYLFTSEFGSIKHTERPHYHALIFLTKEQLDFLGNSVVATFREVWRNGIVSASKQGLFINSLDAISYVTKYITKDLSFEGYSSRFRTIESYDSIGVPRSKEHRAAVRAFLRIFSTKVIASVSYGAYEYSDADIVDGFDIVTSTGVRHYNVPYYNLRKRLFTFASYGDHTFQSLNLTDPTVLPLVVRLREKAYGAWYSRIKQYLDVNLLPPTVRQWYASATPNSFRLLFLYQRYAMDSVHTLRRLVDIVSTFSGRNELSPDQFRTAVKMFERDAFCLPFDNNADITLDEFYHQKDLFLHQDFNFFAVDDFHHLSALVDAITYATSVPLAAEKMYSYE